MRMIRPLAVLAAAAALAACVAPVPPGCAALPGGGRYCLQRSDTVAQFAVTQEVHVGAGGRDDMLIASVEADAAGLRFAGLTPLGQKILVVAYDNREVHAELAPGVDKRLDPALLLALLQLALWPEPAVAAGLAPPLRLGEQGTRREVRDGDRVLLAIERKGEPPACRHLDIDVKDLGLTLRIDTLPDGPDGGTRP